MDCSARLVLSLLAGPNNGQSCDNHQYLLIVVVNELLGTLLVVVATVALVDLAAKLIEAEHIHIHQKILS
jgi:hypothetical protein